VIEGIPSWLTGALPGGGVSLLLLWLYVRAEQKIAAQQSWKDANFERLVLALDGATKQNDAMLRALGQRRPSTGSGEDR
jgi:hypothetical protein